MTAPAHPPPRPAGHRQLGRRTLLVCGLVFLAALRGAWSTMDRSFIGDDFAYVGRFHGMPWREWPALFVKDWSGGLWGYVLPELRPFAALTFLLDAQMWGTNPLGYHLTNFALDATCGCLVALIAWRVLGTTWWLGVTAGVLFVCHPAHAEPVAWITGRVDLAGTLCYLAAFFAAARFLQVPGRRAWLALAWIAYAVGCFTKEFCLTMPVALLLWAVFCGRTSIRARPREIAILVTGFLVAFGGYAWCRQVAFGSGSSGHGTFNLLDPGYLDRQFNYFRWMISPLVVFDPNPAMTWPVLGSAALLVLVGMLFWRWRRPRSRAWRVTLCFGLGWYAIATIPLVVVTYFSARHLHLATAGFCIAIPFLVMEWARPRWLGPAILAVLVVAFAVRFDRAVTPWRHAAKVSENISAEIAKAGTTAPPGQLFLLDIPEAYEGVWLWSWATPFALEPPFMPRLANPVIERPSVYYAPGRWAAERDLSLPSTAPGAILFGIDEANRGTVTRQLISATQLRHAAPSLWQPGQKPGDVDAALAWRQFVQALRTP